MQTTPSPQQIGPYRLDVRLGRGGMGEVYKAWDERLHRWVAIKHLHGRDDPNALWQEARAVAQLEDPTIVQIFDVVEGPDDEPWIVMELVAGPTLAEVLRDGPLDVGSALDYGAQIAGGLASAHAAGFVHRDLKAENVMVALPNRSEASARRAGRIKILDFGLARRIRTTPGSGDPSIGRLLGTPRAMSPEQARQQPADARSDLFALGVLLYELLTGRSPFRAGSVAETLGRVQTLVQPPVQQISPRTPESLSLLVDRLLAKAPDQRPNDAAEVVGALSAIAASSPLFTTGAADLDPSWSAFRTPSMATAVLEPVAVRTVVLSQLAGDTDDMEARARQQLAELLTAHGGTDHSPTGSDLRPPHVGSISTFDQPTNAVRFALAAQRFLHRLERPQGSPLGARIAIHLGEVLLVPTGDPTASRASVGGPAMPTTQRLLDLTRQGQTLLTHAVVEVVRRSATASSPDGASTSDGAPEDPFTWHRHGRYRFVDIDTELDVFEVTPPGSAPVEPDTSGLARRARPSRPAVVESVREPTEATRLRTWSPPKMPVQPYPVLLPTAHPALLAGRDAELDDLRRRLRMPIPVLGLHAPSGAGKSSLLLAGLVPALRADRWCVSISRQPHEVGLAERLVDDLLVTPGRPPLADDDWRTFLDHLDEVERLGGRPPILVLDQFEDALAPEATASRRALGVLLAATVRRRPGRDEPRCRWLLAYRSEAHGDVLAWLGDVLAEARQPDDGSPTDLDLTALPHDLSTPDRYHAMTLSVLATAPPGVAAATHARTVFHAAITRPLAAVDETGEPLYPWHLTSADAERLATHFARARVRRPDAPLTPELQVVLARLLADAGADGRIAVPADLSGLVEQALEEHLRHALDATFPVAIEAPEASDPSPSTERDPRAARTHALLALRELASPEHRAEGLSPAVLSSALGDDAEQVLAQLSTALTRLVVLRETNAGWRFTLSHDQMADAILRVVEEEERHGPLLIDSDLLAARRFVTLNSALHRDGDRSATRISRHQARRIARHRDALLWDDDDRAWWADCRRRRRADRIRASTVVAGLALVLALVVGSAWQSADRSREIDRLHTAVAHGEPEAALQAFHELADRATDDTLRDLLARRETPTDLVELGLGGLDGDARDTAVLRFAEIVLPWVRDDPGDARRIAHLVWALDYAPGRSPRFAKAATTWRNRLLEPLRQRHPPPSLESMADDWVTVPAGHFLRGIGPEDAGNADERPAHPVTLSSFRILRREVTNADYRLMKPDHGGADDMPIRWISYHAAYTYAAWLGGRLPTEAEWEYAARADCPTIYCDRDGRPTEVDAVAWTLRNSRDPDSNEPVLHPVMQLEPNPWGLYDMSGNVFEWTADWYAPYGTEARVDPWGPTVSTSGGRTSRGGTYWLQAFRARPTARRTDVATSVTNYRGFRVVLPLSAELVDGS